MLEVFAVSNVLSWGRERRLKSNYSGFPGTQLHIRCLRYTLAEGFAHRCEAPDRYVYRN